MVTDPGSSMPVWERPVSSVERGWGVQVARSKGGMMFELQGDYAIG